MILTVIKLAGVTTVQATVWCRRAARLRRVARLRREVLVATRRSRATGLGGVRTTTKGKTSLCASTGDVNPNASLNTTTTVLIDLQGFDAPVRVFEGIRVVRYVVFAGASLGGTAGRPISVPPVAAEGNVKDLDRG